MIQSSNRYIAHAGLGRGNDVTAKKGLSPEQIEDYPDAGDLFMVNAGVRGRIEPEFGS